MNRVCKWFAIVALLPLAAVLVLSTNAGGMPPGGGGGKPPKEEPTPSPVIYGIQNLGSFGGAFIIVKAANDSEVVVGAADDGAGNTIAFAYAEGTLGLVDLNSFGPLVDADGNTYVARVALDINNLGEVVGYARLLNSETGDRGFYTDLKTGEITLLPQYGTSDQYNASGINDAGTIVLNGFYTDGLIYRDENIYRVEPDGIVTSWPVAAAWPKINSFGVIVTTVSDPYRYIPPGPDFELFTGGMIFALNDAGQLAVRVYGKGRQEYVARYTDGVGFEKLIETHSPPNRPKVSASRNVDSHLFPSSVSGSVHRCTM